jgi:hypothetical protein
MKRWNFFSLVILLAVGSSVRGQIALWNFDSLTLSPSTTNATSLFNVSADFGTGTASGTHGTAAVFSTPSGNGSAKAISANRWAVGDYWQFQTSTLGYNGIMVSWDQTSSGSGPGFGRLQYSTDGSAFTSVGDDYSILQNGTPHTSWGSSPPRSAFYTFNVDLSGIPALNNASAVYFRLLDDSTVSADGSTVTTAGADRVDNFSVLLVPEPSSLAFVALGALALFASRRK